MILVEEFAVAFRALRVHAENQRILGLGSLPAISEFTKLFGANACVVPRIKDQDDVFPAAEVTERNSAAFMVSQREIGRKLPDRNRFRKQPGQNGHLTLS